MGVLSWAMPEYFILLSLSEVANICPVKRRQVTFVASLVCGFGISTCGEWDKERVRPESGGEDEDMLKRKSKNVRVVSLTGYSIENIHGIYLSYMV
jgi:hypothetical protein